MNYNQNYWLKFPADKVITTCNGTTDFGAPEFYGEDCELLAVSYVDEIFTVVPDACFKVERTWTVINWCTYNPNVGCTYVANPNPNATVNHPTNLPGVTISAPGNTVAGWNPTVVRINPTDPTTSNYATYYTGGTINGVAVGPNSSNNCYQYKQIVKVSDNQDPVAQCPASPVEYCDYST